MVSDTFSPSRIDTSQTIHNNRCFSSFDLAQRDPQLAIEGSSIKKTTFRAGLYKFTCMPFGFSNVDSSFCHLEQWLGDQQFFTLLLFIDDICVFVPRIEDMLDQNKLLFKRLNPFNLKIKALKAPFYISILFLGHVLSADSTSANPMKTFEWTKEYQEVLMH